jgi:thiol:disulfide interchange protein DsbD
VTRRRALLLATAYVLGLGLTFAALGVLSALLGARAQIGARLANPLFVVPLVLLFVALAASMFGAFELRLPSRLQNVLSRVGGAGPGGAFAMGLVGGLIAAPCTGPFLAGALLYVASTGSAWLGASLLFAYALGMGVLFWGLAAFALSLPKSGPWMNAVKSLGGTCLLLAALYFLRPLLPALRTFARPELWFLLTSLLLVVVGLWLGALHLHFDGAGARPLRKGLGILLFTAGCFSVYGYRVAPPTHLPWLYDEQAAFAQASAEGKGVLIDFAASWCAPCQQLEATFGVAQVHAAISDAFVLLKVDVSRDSAASEAQKQRFDAPNLPAVRLVDAERAVIGQIDDEVEPAEAERIIRAASARLGR